MRPVRRLAAPVTALVLATALGLGACSAGADDADSDAGTSSEEGADDTAADTDAATDDDGAEDAGAEDPAEDEGGAGGADAEVVPIEGGFVTEVSVPAGVEYTVTTASANVVQLDFPAPEDPEALSAFYEAWFTEQGMTDVATVSGIVTGTDGNVTWTLVPQDGDWVLAGASI
ncbi:hypothetical protein EXU48_06900 [Occultella glacieicola]|uniref:Uncharacterized protein n=1 Tax=Occultella glacieicola TaxID=2518684 RepID=A0ABY2E5W2_9MICO|nr:hypothetical protein [Occultella glacieicola]TDE95969.1 hypothetical protein EXU48_06900 [Occultella glacieicola]